MERAVIDHTLRDLCETYFKTRRAEASRLRDETLAVLRRTILELKAIRTRIDPDLSELASTLGRCCDEDIAAGLSGRVPVITAGELAHLLRNHDTAALRFLWARDFRLSGLRKDAIDVIDTACREFPRTTDPGYYEVAASLVATSDTGTLAVVRAAAGMAGRLPGPAAAALAGIIADRVRDHGDDAQVALKFFCVTADARAALLLVLAGATPPAPRTSWPFSGIIASGRTNHGRLALGARYGRIGTLLRHGFPEAVE